MLVSRSTAVWSQQHPRQASRLLACLEDSMTHVEKQLRKRGYPGHIVSQAADDAKIIAVRAIASGAVARMTPDHRRNWLLLVARRCAATRARSNMRLLIHVEAPENMCRDVPCGLGDEEVTVLRDAMQKLSLVQRVVLRCYFFEGMTKREIAAAMSVTRRRVNAWLKTIIAELHSQLCHYFWEK